MVKHGRQYMSYAHDGATRKNISRVWCLTEGCYWVWCYEGGNELTYRQVSQVTDTPDEVKTCPTHCTPPPQERERSYIGDMEIKQQIDTNKIIVLLKTTTPTFPYTKN
jgi:hypothetical protein